MDFRYEYLYQIRIFNEDDEVVAVYDNLTSCYIRKHVNHIGMVILTVPEGHDILQYAAVDDTLLEIWLGYPQQIPARGWGLDWSRDYVGLFRDRQIATDADGSIYHLLYVTSLLEILSRYVSAYPAGVSGKSTWANQYLSTVCNDVVYWNCTANGTTANGRIRDTNVVRGLTTFGAVVLADLVDYSVGPGRNVLEFLQEIAPHAGFDFDVVRYTGTPGQVLVQFVQYLGQLGQDRHTTVVFDMALDNLASANLDYDGLREKTAAIVGGQGESTNRYFVTRVGENYSTPSNDYEMFVDARDKDDDELEAFGDAQLNQLRSRLQINNRVQLSRGWVYKRDFSHGDLVTVSFAGFQETKKIGIVEIKFDQDQRNEIRLEFVEP